MKTLKKAATRSPGQKRHQPALKKSTRLQAGRRAKAPIWLVQRLVKSEPGFTVFDRVLPLSPTKPVESATAMETHLNAGKSLRESVRTTLLLDCFDERSNAQCNLIASVAEAIDFEVARGNLSAAQQLAYDLLRNAEIQCESDYIEHDWLYAQLLAIGTLGPIATIQEDLEQAVHLFNKTSSIVSYLMAADFRNALWQRESAIALFNVATCFRACEFDTGGIPQLKACLSVLRTMQERCLPLGHVLTQLCRELEHVSSKKSKDKVQDLDLLAFFSGPYWTGSLVASFNRPSRT